MTFIPTPTMSENGVVHFVISVMRGVLHCLQADAMHNTFLPYPAEREVDSFDDFQQQGCETLRDDLISPGREVHTVKRECRIFQFYFSAEVQVPESPVVAKPFL